MQTEDSPQARVFFALWPAPSVQSQLHALAMQYQQRCEARVMRVDTLHMTLLFLGSVQRAWLPRLAQAASQVSVPRFEMVLDNLSFWPHQRIAYATSQAELPMLNTLVSKLRQEVAVAGFTVENRGFTPHVTLLRHVQNGYMPESQVVTPILWPAESFVLVESVMTEQGASYPRLCDPFQLK